ncbi:hypothetical protein Q0590_03550 [Rhodocytophaga aerolata]|uniref:Uncharacterized protein n=1 Tax=Rhodocytophaga aerolata TaxID=455078 RepID=A0ABT8QZP0_9BACT|nr:hypothetical protein [Rhodocytophaga aerolata]MDO1445308.1 hypothetical protein [Rhodocytophaga aerolata]
MEENIQLLQLCLTQIEQQLGWGENSRWTHQDFEELSERIYCTTKIRLSVTTLKRLWGKVAYTSSPTLQTLNTLAAFAGYSTWRAFKLAHTPAALPEEPPTEAVVSEVALPELPQEIRSHRKATAYVYTLAICLILIMVGFISYGLIFKSFSVDPSAIRFSSQPVTLGVPNTVIFHYDATASPSDDIAIQQSWDQRLRENVSREGHQYTTTYYYPGYHRAKLLINNQVIKEHDVYIKTDGWLALIENEPVPLYVKDKIIDKGILQASLSSLEKFKLASNEQIPWLDYYNVQDFGELASDDFSFETEVKNETNTGNAVCQESRITIMCSNGRMLVPLAIPGCVGNINLTLGDLYLEGRINDLSAFGCDLSQWQKLRLEVKNRQVSIFLNGKQIYRTVYSNDAGKVVGIRYKFMGAGAVNYVRLWDKHKKLVFEDEFE